MHVKPLQALAAVVIEVGDRARRVTVLRVQQISAGSELEIGDHRAVAASDRPQVRRAPSTCTSPRSCR